MGACDKAKGSAHWKPGKSTKSELKFLVRLSMKKQLARKIKGINEIAEAVFNLLQRTHYS